MGPVVEAQGTDRLLTFVQEPGESVAGWKVGGVDVLVTYRDRAEAGRGMIVQQAAGEFLALGVGFELSFRRPEPDGSEIRVRSVEHGRYEGERWIALHPTPQGRTHLLEPGVARIQLDIEEDR
jgi:hypothetical protein